MKLPDSWGTVRLTEVCELNPRLLAEDRPDDDAEVTFVPMSAVDETSGVISKPELRKFTEVAKGYTSFRERDVLFAKVTPCMENGKAAIVGPLSNGLGFGSTEFHVLRPTEAVLPEYVFHFIRQQAFRNHAASAFIGTGGLQRVPPDFLSRVKLPLPTLPEQQRIVEVLRQAEAVSKAKQSLSEQIDHLVRTAYWEHFGDWYTADGLRDPVRISEYVADSQYGVSEAMEGTGAHAVLRMNSITTSGWLNLSDLKYANLSKKDVDATELKSGDLLFNRTNSKELVGKCAIWRDAKVPFSFASYLIRLRLKEGMLPEYLWATLNSAYGKYRLMNSAKQAVSMANVSPTDLGRITVPLPPLRLQIKFATLVRAVEELRSVMLNKLSVFDELQREVTTQALIGNITVAWRKNHGEEIATEMKARDNALRPSRTKISIRTEVSAPPERTPLKNRTARHMVLNELSDFQGFVLDAMREWKGSLLVDDAVALDNFLQQWPIEHEQDMHDVALRALEQLVGLGLIAKVALPNEQNEYVTGYRMLRPEEETRSKDIARLHQLLNLHLGESDE